MIEIARMVVFVRTCSPERGPEGPILYSEGAFKTEVDNVGVWDVGDLLFESFPKLLGLQVLEGWIEVGHGDDPEVTLVGSWRKLTHWEMCRVRDGLTPWEHSEL